MTITVTFDPPLPSDSPATFNTKAFALLGDLNSWSTEANALQADVNTKQGTVSTAATTATTKAGEASTSATTASAQAGIATTKAGEASTSATNALSSANAAAASAATLNFAAPGPIGGTTPGSGAFTTLKATGNLGVGTASPKARFESLDVAITGGGPATSGSATDPNAMARLGGATVCMDFGLYSTGKQWIQTRAAANYATNLDLILNPNGGAVLHGIGGLGYASGIGAGGTADQSTFGSGKNRAVDLNKVTGLITMNADSLAAGASVLFYLNNTTIGAYDSVVAQAWSVPNKYKVDVITAYTSTAQIRVTNITAGALAEALVVSFVVLKGSMT